MPRGPLPASDRRPGTLARRHQGAALGAGQEPRVAFGHARRARAADPRLGRPADGLRGGADVPTTLPAVVYLQGGGLRPGPEELGRARRLCAPDPRDARGDAQAEGRVAGGEGRQVGVEAGDVNLRPPEAGGRLPRLLALEQVHEAAAERGLDAPVRAAAVREPDEAFRRRRRGTSPTGGAREDVPEAAERVRLLLHRHRARPDGHGHGVLARVLHGP